MTTGNLRVQRPSTSRSLRARFAADPRGGLARMRDPRILRLTLAAALLVALGVFHIWSRTRVLAT
ncbi:MAG TPA: hypothetical protein VD838_18730, partial [Anaeromyxobacteraceae bacterium]|nr:hypothetical protein [Anaeromyxobacteraceae bacterium]